MKTSALVDQSINQSIKKEFKYDAIVFQEECRAAVTHMMPCQKLMTSGEHRRMIVAVRTT